MKSQSNKCLNGVNKQTIGRRISLGLAIAFVLGSLTFTSCKKKEEKPGRTIRGKEEKKEGEEKKTDLIFVENAGLVLLWPFLTFYFETLELTKDNKFISKQAAARAVYLIQYLVTGNEDSGEHSMFLNKLLCNIPRKHPVENQAALTAFEKEFSEELLTTLISRWKAIKNTSIDGLRLSFLQRAGKLEWEGEKIALTVESKPFDMLLDRIPWSVSVIKLPWMENTLYVKWR